jgi:hypothetical protein
VGWGKKKPPGLPGGFSEVVRAVQFECALASATAERLEHQK